MNRMIAMALLAVTVIAQTFVHAETATDEDLRAIVESYVVREGDTLAKLARKHLGPDALWNTNVAVNPDLDDPDIIMPGQVINIITGYEQPAPVVAVEVVEVYQAVIEKIFNVVEKNVKRSDWRDAIEGDRLFPLDAVRTLADSSAVLQFDGATTVLVTEYSQIFLRALEPQDSGVSRSEIEIRSGETELRLEQIDAPQQQIEINVAGTITRPARGADGNNSTRARKVGNDRSQVMVYEGSSAVQSAGVSVAVETGMGTTAVAGQAPAEPERLLPAPEIHALVDEVFAENIEFSWEPLDGAAAYRLDVCKDRHCTQPIFNQRGIPETTLTVSSLPIGISYWRVTAVSESGLDGFTSLSGELKIVAVPEQTESNYLLWALIAASILFLIAAVMFLRYFSRRSAVTDTTKTIEM
ncbi:MAG: LysM peptidoglycan-binding domain-containing protein [Gammaproteobacteria bacterium]|nr:LysM peptidoglycan-binding domain-containing protein [Gammaproteobacteria bacterium]MBU2676223.1 LysM peptidoglycan-binding domain-containing protein [Gammaproteobacteria bacterium]NNC55942.1 LysM peptidoglycan-binding domain-containing protein [Woeseiaceae bacterium]NNL49959.1 LysM peptidoglycan-binding domain-containing protein [Woeseiaceae bacterium]